MCQVTRESTLQQFLGKESSAMSRPPKWAYLIGGILIVMSCILAVTIMFAFLEMIPRGMDIQMPLLFIILPLSIVIPLTMVAMAIVLVKMGV
jgi:hypothetical protein